MGDFFFHVLVTSDGVFGQGADQVHLGGEAPPHRRSQREVGSAVERVITLPLGEGL